MCQINNMERNGIHEKFQSVWFGGGGYSGLIIGKVLKSSMRSSNLGGDGVFCSPGCRLRLGFLTHFFPHKLQTEGTFASQIVSHIESNK